MRKFLSRCKRGFRRLPATPPPRVDPPASNDSIDPLSLTRGGNTSSHLPYTTIPETTFQSQKVLEETLAPHPTGKSSSQSEEEEPVSNLSSENSQSREGLGVTDSGAPNSSIGEATVTTSSYVAADPNPREGFYQLFPNIPKDESLIKNYECALRSEFLVIKGRLYISESYVCFYASTSEWVTSFVIPFQEINEIKKTTTADLQAIQILTHLEAYTFTYFPSRDETYYFMDNVWQLSKSDSARKPAQNAREEGTMHFADINKRVLKTGAINHAPGLSQDPDEAMKVLPSYSEKRMSARLFRFITAASDCGDLTSAIDPHGFSSAPVAKGGYSDIWTARYRDGGKKVAVKVLRFASPSDDTVAFSLKGLLHEMYNWSALDHENIHKLVGAVMFRERLGMVSEWMENGNLRHYLSQNGDVDRQEFCTQIARGVAYLHHSSVVHGDLKACNILVSSDRILKITDFDYSIVSDCKHAFTATARMGGGTLRWMAPELLMTEHPTRRNRATDVYALGMTLLETMTNADPYSECNHDIQILLKHTRKEYPIRPTEYFPDDEQSNWMWDLLVQCWNHNPLFRPMADGFLKSLLGLKEGISQPNAFPG